VLLVATVLLVGKLREDPDGRLYPWALNAFVAAMYAGFVLILATALMPLDWSDEVAWPLDAWLLLVVALTLWGIHRAPII
jgi:hypothetical protein